MSAAAPLVRALNWADEQFDQVLYRPLTVKATRWLPRWWRCALARVAVRLADATGDEDLADFNFALCQACQRRMTWTEIGGEYGLPGPFALCWWCEPYLPDAPLDEVDDWPATLAEAGKRSMGWRWQR